MRFSALPPVRRAVPLRRRGTEGRASMERFFENRRITLYASGTAALAQAMARCAARSSATAPEVIVPSYGCPDLVAACIYASVYPRLVDVAASGWSYDQEALSAKLSPNTVAVVAVNLLGIGDGSTELVRLCKDQNIPLIQDSAQYLPREAIDWPGDYIVLSFGRGKPLNLLHGGALIYPPGNADTPSGSPAHYSRRDRLLDTRAAAVAFNFLTRPHIYRILSTLPGTGLGDVIYKPLANGAPLPEVLWERVGPAFELYREKSSYRRDTWAPALQEWSDLGIVALDCPGSPVPAEPLRLCLLAPHRPAREVLVETLNRSGLGASRFYGADLSQISGVPELVKRQGPFPKAHALAGRLFTLPTHRLVKSDAVRATRDLVIACHRSGRIEVPDHSRAL